MDWAKGCSAKQNRTTKEASSPAGYTDGSHTHQLHQGATQHEKRHHTDSGRAGVLIGWSGVSNGVCIWATGLHRLCKPEFGRLTAFGFPRIRVTKHNKRAAVRAEIAWRPDQRPALTKEALEPATLSPLLCYVFSSCLRSIVAGFSPFWQQLKQRYPQCVIRLIGSAKLKPANSGLRTPNSTGDLHLRHAAMGFDVLDCLFPVHGQHYITVYRYLSSVSSLPAVNRI
jgi:hypothetical protein